MNDKQVVLSDEQIVHMCNIIHELPADSQQALYFLISRLGHLQETNLNRRCGHHYCALCRVKELTLLLQRADVNFANAVKSFED